MSHWSEDAQQASRQDMGDRMPDSPTLDCETRSWEPLAEIEQLPAWELQAQITAGPAELSISTAGPTQPPGAAVTSSAS